MNSIKTGLHTQSIRRASLLSSALVALAMLMPVDVMAQSAPGASAESGDIVVTARRRDESLSRSPIAITAITADELVKRSITTDSDLQISAPGLTIRQTQGNNSLTYSIRGQSADTFSGSPSAVISYLNEVPLVVGQASSFYDLQSVQVLKGPQGTLFGRNTTGGAVLYTSAKPSNEFEASVRGKVGNLDLREVEGMVNFPIVDDTVLLRAAVNVTSREGYIDNLFTGQKLGEIDRKSGRLSLTVRPNDRLENQSILQYTKSEGTNTGASYTYSVYGCGQKNNGFNLTCNAGLLFSPLLDTVAGPGAWAAYLAAHPKAFPAGIVAYVDEQRRLGPYKTNHPFLADHEGEDWNFSNTTTYELSDTLRIKNIFGYSKSDVDSIQPQLGAPFVTILTADAAKGLAGNEQHAESYSEELQLSGEGFGGDLTYIAGLYYQNLDVETVWPQTYFDVSPRIPAATLTDNFKNENETKAIYAQGTYNIGKHFGVEGLRATAGLRYTQEDVSFTNLPGSTFKAGLPGQETSFEDPSWEVGLEWQATDTTFTYVKTRGSFRSGGFNGSAPPINFSATGGGNLFDSEHTQDVEWGLKYRGDIGGMRTTFNVDAYYQWIQDVQRVEFPDPDGPLGPLASIAVTVNLPDAEVKGIEFDGSIAPTDWLEVGASGSYTEAEFINGNVTLFGTPFAYGPVGDTPKASGVLWAQVNFPVSEDIGKIGLRGEVYSQTSQYFSNSFDSIAPNTKLPGYSLVSGRLTWDGIMGSKVSAAIFGKNLTEEEYFVGGMQLASALGHNAAAVGEPRTFGLELSYKY